MAQAKTEIFQGNIQGLPELLAVKTEYKPVMDPRPDLVEDSELWTKLLQLAEAKNPDLAEILNVFRCMGTRVRQGEKGYILRPDIDATGSQAWTSLEEYGQDKNKWLKPRAREIKELLQSLSGEVAG